MRRKKKMSLFVTSVLFFNIMCLPCIYADDKQVTTVDKQVYTVDDLRDIIGKDRVDKVYTVKEIEKIREEYMKAEKTNSYAKIFELGKKIDVYSETEKEYLELQKEIEKNQKELTLSFMSGESVSEVLKLNTQLESSINKISKLKEKGYEFEVEYVENVWTEEYANIQENVKKMSKDYVLGDLGNSLKSPVKGKFYISSLFGMRRDPITLTDITFHKGLDLSANFDDEVFAQFNGVVTNVYYSETGGNTIEISHGPDLVTKYLHLNKPLVEVGQEVKQYDVIGLAGSTGTRSTGPHLHFTVVLDGEYVNPVYLYGAKGLTAFKAYMSMHPNTTYLVDKDEIEQGIKETPTYNEEDVEVEVEQRYIRGEYVPKEGDDREVIKVAPVEEIPNPFDYDVYISQWVDEEEADVDDE